MIASTAAQLKREKDQNSVVLGSKNSELHKAAMRNDLIKLRTLLQSDKNPNIKNINGSTPLHLAASKSHVHAVNMLLKAGADPLICNDAGLNAVEIGLFMGSIHLWDS